MGTASGVLVSLLALVSSSVLLAAIMLALLAIDAAVASVAAVGFGASYGLITRLSRRCLQQNSQCVAHVYGLDGTELSAGPLPTNEIYAVPATP